LSGSAQHRVCGLHFPDFHELDFPLSSKCVSLFGEQFPRIGKRLCSPSTVFSGIDCAMQNTAIPNTPRRAEAECVKAFALLCEWAGLMPWLGGDAKQTPADLFAYVMSRGPLTGAQRDYLTRLNFLGTLYLLAEVHGAFSSGPRRNPESSDPEPVEGPVEGPLNPHLSPRQ
jgi:hypothetical protein